MEKGNESIQPEAPPSWTTIRLYANTSCTFCGNPLMVNGVQSELFCYQCKRSNPVSESMWSSLVAELARVLKSGSNYSESHFSASDKDFDIYFTYNREAIKCQGCQAELPFTVTEAESPKLVCPSCNTETSLRKVPGNLQSSSNALQWIVAEEFNFSGESKLTNQTFVQKCPSCGGSLSVDGKSRVVTCSFCDSKVTLSEEVLQRLDPVQIRKPWYLVFKRSLYKTERDRLEDKARAKRNKKKDHRTHTPPVAQTVKKTSIQISFGKAFDVWFRKQGGFIWMIVWLLLGGRVAYLFVESGQSLFDFLGTPAQEEELPIFIQFILAVLAPIVMFVYVMAIKSKLARGWVPEDDKDDDQDDYKYSRDD